MVQQRPRVFRKDRLREIRTRRGLTQAELAERTGASKNQIGRYEAGLIDPSIDYLVHLVQVLGVSADWLIGVSDSEQGILGNLSEVESQLVQAFRDKNTDEVMRITTQIDAP